MRHNASEKRLVCLFIPSGTWLLHFGTANRATVTLDIQELRGGYQLLELGRGGESLQRERGTGVGLRRIRIARERRR
jgi:hypothetical protein